MDPREIDKILFPTIIEQTPEQRFPWLSPASPSAA